MITKDELNIANDSYIKKDFYQIYPEILDLVSKITERWDPQSSNESDPGIVLLKLLAFIADKNNYNIDKNILECFMPSATQSDSMQKLCDMMGYDMHYYKSSSTSLAAMWSTNMYDTDEESSESKNFVIVIPKFTALTSSEDENVKYITTEELTLTTKGYKQEVLVLEGVINDLTVGDSDIIRLYNLDDNNRIYLPETAVAENGIFINSVSDSTIEWKPVSNLYTQISGSYTYKFGYDSNKKLPYIEFPRDIDTLIGEGLKIKYVRTSGVAGNVKPKVLNKITSISNVYKKYESSDETEELTEDDEQYLVIANLSASVSGQDIETIDSAYNSFKKTVGTFDTLVTCRDYANAIYNLVDSSSARNPIVSNVQVSDIRDDLSKSFKVMTFNTFGICFVDTPAYTEPETSGEDPEPAITNFDLYIYPFTAVSGEYDTNAYNLTFKPDYSNMYAIEQGIEENKTISHNIQTVGKDDLFAIKNYYKLSVKVNTIYKVNKAEQKDILSNIQEALYNEFNSRKVDFGEDLVYEEIFKTIENADSRIKNIYFDYDIRTKFMTGDGNEYDMFDATTGPTVSNDTYIDLLVKNILAGRLNMFKYSESFGYTLGQEKIPTLDSQYGSTTGSGDPSEILYSLKTEYPITASSVSVSNPVKLEENENIIFIAPNLVDDYIYPYGINYNWSPANPDYIIKKNQEYQLTSSDVLYVKYTDSNSNEIGIKYEADKYTKWVNGVAQAPADWLGVIKPNFSLKKSVAYSNGTWQISDVPSYWTGSVQGFNNITDANNQISILKKMEDTIPSADQTQKYYPIFWITKSGEIENGHILEDGEYFFVTDITKTSLVSYGTGTKIEFEGSGSSLKLSKKSTSLDPSIEDIANNGLNAIASSVWYNFKPSNADISKIIIKEMRIITLGEDCTLNSIELQEFSGDTTPGEINNTFKPVKDANYTLVGPEPEDLPKIPGGLGWEVRSRLNLNIGPELTQHIDATKHIFELTFKDGSSIELCDEAGSGVSTISLRCNYVLQEGGSDNISLQVFVEDSEQASGYREVDDLAFLVFDDSGVHYGDTGSSTIEMNNFSDYYTALADEQLEAELPVCIPNGYMGLMFLYYEATEQSGSVASVSVTAEDGSISYYNSDNIWSGELLPGLNVIKVSQPTTKITIEKSAECKLVISDISIVSSSYNGIDLEKLGFSKNIQAQWGSISTKILDKIRKVAGDNFCYNAHLDNTLLINYTPTDYEFWIDPNNVCRKFAIGQIDSDLKNIVIVEGSKLK